jgi:hypothetical protein
VTPPVPPEAIFIDLDDREIDGMVALLGTFADGRRPPAVARKSVASR